MISEIWEKLKFVGKTKIVAKIYSKKKFTFHVSRQSSCLKPLKLIFVFCLFVIAAKVNSCMLLPKKN